MAKESDILTSVYLVYNKLSNNNHLNFRSVAITDTY